MSDALPMAGKVVLVTGATGGIGKATAIGLATMGARVGITGRDLIRAEQASAEIRTASGNPAGDVFAADMSSQVEVRRLAGAVLDAYPRLDVLVNNVGGFWAHRHPTADGLEHTFALNHLAPFLLTNLLVDLLRASAPARVVTVSSGAQAAGRIDFDDLQGARRYSGQRAYSQSKLANILFTNELARRLQGTGVTANSVHPGVVRTNFGSEDQAGFFRIVSPLVRRFLKTPTQGAWTPIYLASSPDVEGITGRFFASCKPKAANKAVDDEGVTARLWRDSADLVGLAEFPVMTGPR
jgi:retinol dehydrogenase 14